MSDDVIPLSLRTMVDQVLSIVPIPLLRPAWDISKAIWDGVQQTSDNHHQLLELIKTIVGYLNMLKGLSAQDVQNLQQPVDRFKQSLVEIQEFCQKNAKTQWLKRVFKKDEFTTKIAALHHRLLAACTQFNVQAQVNIAARQADMRTAADKDHAKTQELLVRMTHNFALFEERAAVRDTNMMTMMMVIRRELVEMRARSIVATNQSEEEHRQFLTSTLDTLQRLTHSTADLAPWTVTSFEVERESEIGRGGYSVVYRGTWRGQVVAIKEFKGEINEKKLQQEADLWNRLRGDNIVQMYGASIYEKPPFMIMPFLPHGNVLQYLEENPNSDRLKLVKGVAAGLECLHGGNVVHGDLKADNILVDAAGNAVLCDFGLSTIKRNIRTKTADFLETAAGSLRWMSPERIRPGRLTMPGDVYSFGITVWEIYAEDVPFGFMEENHLKDYIILDEGRPEPRPLTMPEQMWTLIQICWATLEATRPPASEISKTLKGIVAERNAIPLSPQVQPIMLAEELELTASLNLLEHEVSYPRPDQLVSACQDNNLDQVRKFLQEGAKINAATTEGMTPLIAASRNGHSELVRTLLDNGADAGLVQAGWTALYAASDKGHIEVVTRLLDAGCDPNQTVPGTSVFPASIVNRARPESWTALHIASRNGHRDIVQLLLERGAHIAQKYDNKAKYGRTALRLAAENGRVDVVKLLLESWTRRTFEDLTMELGQPLIEAARLGYTEIVILLLKVGANPSSEEAGFASRSPLRAAAHAGHTTIVEILLDHGAPIDASSQKSTALSLAVQAGHTSVVDLLIQRGAKVKQQKLLEYSERDWAKRNGHTEMVRILERAQATQRPAK